MKSSAFKVELRLRRHDGEHRWHTAEARPLREESEGMESAGMESERR